MNANCALRVELLGHSGGEANSALAARLCYSDADITALKDRVTSSEQSKFLGHIRELGHYSVFEHVSFTFGVEGVSRVLTHQLVRHRVASYSQKSQRYVSHEGGFLYVTPPSVKDSAVASEKYNAIMDKLAECYDELIKLDVAPEDARYVLPNACETKIIVTMNARELLHFFTLRCCERAQWEIRALATEMLKLVKPIAPSIFTNAGPSCVGGACSEGKMSCGNSHAIRNFFKNL